MGIRAIARRLGVARNTVRQALRSDAPPRYERRRPGSAVDAFEPTIRQLLAEFPTMPATVITERVGWERSMTVLRDRVAELRPLFMPPDPCQRTTYRPGELAQFDLWQPDVEIPVWHNQAAKLWVVVGVCGFSRFLGAWMIPSRQTHDVLGGHLRVLEQFGALPRKVVWDQEGAIGQWRGSTMALTEEFQAFRGALGVGALLCQRGDAEAKGLVERANGYLETSFLPGRRFEDVGDFNRQLTGWLIKASNRIHATTKVRPSEAMWEERGSMLAFPPVLPDTSLRFRIRLPRDHYVAVDANDYSINPPLRGPAHRRAGHPRGGRRPLRGDEVARHRRCLSRNQSLLTAEHARILRAMRAERVVTEAFAAAVEERDLAAYDRVAEAADGHQDQACHRPRLPVPGPQGALARPGRRPSGRAGPDRRMEPVEFLAACLEREVAARQSNGGELRIRAARFPARKTLEEFDFDHQRNLRREVIAHLDALDFVEARENVVFLGPPRRA